MTYSGIVKEAKKTLKNVDTKKINQHLAVEIDIVGDGEGAFYIEFEDHKVHVEPYEYYDRDLLIRTDADTIIGVLSGKISLDKAKENSIIEGDLSKTAILKDILGPSKLENKKATSIKIGTTKVEATKIGTTKAEATKIGTTKADATKIATSKTETTKIGTTKTESTKISTSKKESAKISTTKTDTAKITDTKAETPKISTTKKTTDAKKPSNKKSSGKKTNKKKS